MYVLLSGVRQAAAAEDGSWPADDGHDHGDAKSKGRTDNFAVTRILVAERERTVISDCWGNPLRSLFREGDLRSALETDNGQRNAIHGCGSYLKEFEAAPEGIEGRRQWICKVGAVGGRACAQATGDRV